jgi:serine/tyrosine/threonine adenylyltransferase
MESLISKKYKNSFVAAFPGDASGDLNPRQTPGMMWSKAAPTAVARPVLLGWSDELAQELGVSKPVTQAETDILGGNHVTDSMYPYAARYGGHQFGSWAGQLGDGRAITLGEWESKSGKTWELQLKGAGQTAYSRRADGRAVLRSSVREFLMSEAMYFLGVPTTRALSLAGTGDQVLRDMFYDGHAGYEPGAVVMRVAPTFVRFGNFEILADRGEIDNLSKLVNWVIDRHFPHITGEDKVLRWFSEVVERTAVMIVEWLRVGFVHGVMNTDNMSVLGLTIDYGPYSFMDEYNPAFTPNTTDLPGRRYAFGRQSSIAYWNLGCLANALVPLFESTERLAEALESYVDIFWSEFYKMMAGKLGLDEIRSDDNNLITDLEKMLVKVQADMTIFYQLLIDLPADIQHDESILLHFDACFYKDLNEEEVLLFSSWIRDYALRLKKNTISREESVSRMKKSNPRFILRNYLLHQAIEGLEKGDDKLFSELQEAIKSPYSDKHNKFFVRRPEWAAQKAGCSMLSCSS